MSIRVKDLPFLDFYSNKSKSTKKVQSVVFPNTIQLGVDNITTSSLQFCKSLFFKEDGISMYSMSSGSFLPENAVLPDLGASSSRWGTLYSTSGSFSEQVDGKIKQYFTFQCVATTTSRFYIPWNSSVDSTSIAANDVGLTVVRPGRVLRAAVRSSLGVGVTIVSLHLNQSTTIIASDSSTLSAADRDVFTFGDEGEFVAGNEIHIGIDPTSAGSNWTGMVEIEFDTNGSVGL